MVFQNYFKSSVWSPAFFLHFIFLEALRTGFFFGSWFTRVLEGFLWTAHFELGLDTGLKFVFDLEFDFGLTFCFTRRPKSGACKLKEPLRFISSIFALISNASPFYIKSSCSFIFFCASPMCLHELMSTLFLRIMLSIFLRLLGTWAGGCFGIFPFFLLMVFFWTDDGICSLLLQEDSEFDPSDPISLISICGFLIFLHSQAMRGCTRICLVADGRLSGLSSDFLRFWGELPRVSIDHPVC